MGCNHSAVDETEVQHLSYSEEKFLSGHKCSVILAPNKVSTFELISEEFEEKFGKPISVSSLQDYYRHSLRGEA